MATPACPGARGLSKRARWSRKPLLETPPRPGCRDLQGTGRARGWTRALWIPPIRARLSRTWSGRGRSGRGRRRSVYRPAVRSTVRRLASSRRRLPFACCGARDPHSRSSSQLRDRSPLGAVASSASNAETLSTVYVDPGPHRARNSRNGPISSSRKTSVRDSMPSSPCTQQRSSRADDLFTLFFTRGERDFSRSAHRVAGIELTARQLGGSFQSREQTMPLTDLDLAAPIDWTDPRFHPMLADLQGPRPEAPRAGSCETTCSSSSMGALTRRGRHWPGSAGTCFRLWTSCARSRRTGRRSPRTAAPRSSCI